MKHHFLVGLLMLSAFSLFGQKSVTPLPLDSNAKFGQDYLFYALPKTVFKVDIEVNRTNEMAGIYANYAEKLLGLTNVISQNKISFSLKNVEIETVVKPDTNFVFAVELSQAQMAGGMFAKYNLHRAAIGEGREKAVYTPEGFAIPDFFRYYSDLTYTEQENNYVETQIVDGVVRQVPAVKVSKVTKSNEQQAQEAADMISKIRNDRYALLTGSQEVAYSAEALKLMVDELNELEKNYLALFTGFTVDETERFTIYVPADEIRNFAFSISPKAGFSPTAARNENENYYIEVSPQDYAARCTDFTERLGCDKKYKPKAGYRVREASTAKLSLTRGTSSVRFLGESPIYQFGKIETLPLGLDDLDILEFGIIY